MISKVLQTVANGVLFGKKEEYLTPLNDFVKEYQNQVLQFLDALGTAREPKAARKQSAPPAAPPVAAESEVVVRVRNRGRAATTTAFNRRSKSMDCLDSMAPAAIVRQKGGTEKKEKMEGKREPSSADSEKNRMSDSFPPVRSAVCEKSTFDDHTFTYGELMGIIQYLTVYWQKMKPHLIKMDNNSGMKHTENYIQLSVLLEKLGVTSQNVVQQFSEIESNKKKKRSKTSFFSRMRSSSNKP
eukprot:CAMPEP_0117002548 /NCGR_PEP_ID=MMETSP0472-20121206/4180_1 /TAXON_ID=693140 ORGANISM="Tiarina fusus, Strain LIS" /NCGR_SAMPLE_ID=MMETSP0472 /ASSEMBLY_ACC=CAM_ASM_000603 /LENGTH=241 /DNA_ID=CAMNT_0004702931 /DNA_START=711 /DNA_END=1433 /DNA_ORIENTATION=+